MRVLRAVLIAFGLACVWYGGQLSEVGRAVGDAAEELRVAHPFASVKEEQRKIAATSGVLDSLAEGFGIMALVIGVASIGCGVFPWGRVLRAKTTRPPESS